ncbi:hypothetical protein JCM16303_000089 [Sporobolomyces ruberrimus]
MAASNSRTQLLTPSSLRLDSRLPLELRSISFSILPSPPSSHSPSSPSFPPALADGYSRVSHGLTTVTSSVFGPRESLRTGPFSGQANQGGQGGGTQKGDRGTVNVEVGTAAWGERVSNLPSSNEGGLRKGGKDRRTIELASSIKNTFEPVLLLHLYPRSSIDIYLEILESDGSVLQAAINATTLALISAGLPLSDYICSISLASYPSLPPLGPPQIPPFSLTSPSSSSTSTSRGGGSGSTVLLDLLNVEEQSLPNLTLAVLPRSGKVTLVSLESRVGVLRFEEMLRWGIEAGKVLQSAMEEAVREWAESLEEGRKGLGGLFPGIGGMGDKKVGEGEDEEMDL